MTRPRAVVVACAPLAYGSCVACCLAYVLWRTAGHASSGQREGQVAAALLALVCAASSVVPLLYWTHPERPRHVLAYAILLRHTALAAGLSALTGFVVVFLAANPTLVGAIALVVAGWVVWLNRGLRLTRKVGVARVPGVGFQAGPVDQVDQALLGGAMKNTRLTGQMLATAVDRVATVSIPASAGENLAGSGFLVGPDLLLTARHVSDAVAEDPGLVEVRFDGDGKVRCHLHGSWLVARGESLDWALLRLDHAMGDESAGEGALTPRGWYDLSSPPPQVAPGFDLTVVGFPGANVVHDLGQVRSIVDTVFVHHSAKTMGGVSGGPYFVRYKPAGVHKGSFDETTNRGTLLAAFVEVLRPHLAPPPPA